MTGLPEAVVIFGAGGFIGRNLVEALAGKVPTVIGVNRTPGPVPGCSATVPIAALSQLSALPADTVLIHAAAARYDARTFRAQQSAILDENAVLATTIYRFAVERGIKEVRLASSVAVYPAAAVILDDEQPIDLNAPPHPSEAGYAWSKRWAEIVADLHHPGNGIATQTFRLTNPYGPHDSTDPDAAHVVAALILRALAEGGVLELRGNPNAERDFVYVGDVVWIFLESLRRRGIHNAYNLAAGGGTRIRDLAARIVAAADPGKEIRIAEESQGVAVRRATAAKLSRTFPLPPFRSLDEGLALTVPWYRNAIGR